MGYSNKNNYKSHMKTFLDFFMIANAESVYFVRHKYSYNSTFAKTAASINNRPFKIIETNL